MYEIFEKLCARNNITAYRFCKDKEVNSSTISTWKKNNSLAGPELSKKVCDYFGVSLDYLMGNSFIEDMGSIIQEERHAQNLSLEELTCDSGITSSDLRIYEANVEPIREDIYEDILERLGTTHFELLDKYGLYDEHIPAHFNGDVVQWEAFKKARDLGGIAENTEMDEDILLISRAAKKMTPENRKKLLDMAKIMFAEDFDDSHT